MVLEEGAAAAKVEETIKNMPTYFADYDTTVHFISEEELKANHSGIPHGGFVLRSGKTGWNQENSHLIEYSLKLDSTPEFTSSLLIAYARASYRLDKEGQSGCKTDFDIAQNPEFRRILPTMRNLNYIICEIFVFCDVVFGVAVLHKPACRPNPIPYRQCRLTDLPRGFVVCAAVPCVVLRLVALVSEPDTIH